MVVSFLVFLAVEGCLFWAGDSYPLREKRPNMELFLVRILLYMDQK